MRFFSSKYFKFILIFFLLFTLCWSLFVMLPAIKKFKSGSNNAEMLDLSPKKNSAEVYKYFDQIDWRVRDGLGHIYLFEDFIFPMAYGPFILFTLLFFGNRVIEQKKLLWICLLPPLIMVIFDYCENFSILKVIRSYPMQVPVASKIILFTVIKWSTGIVSGIMIITFWGLRMRKKNR